MSHEQHETTDPFWTHDVLLAEGVLLHTGFRGAQPRGVRMRLHVSEETYPRGHGRSEIVPLFDEPGTRVYVLAHPYVEIPNMTLQIGLYPQPSETGAVGEVINSHVEGTRPLHIGSAQAWYYPAEQTVVLWELILADHTSPAHVLPAEDETYLALWRGFEQQLVALFPEAQQMATPSWDPDYANDEWRRMLTTLGYTVATPLAFSKPITRPAAESQPAT